MEGRVEALGATTGFERVRHPTTGEWNVPVLPEFDASEVASAIARIRAEAGPDPSAGLLVVFDTGVADGHPLLRPFVTSQVDFTGQGPGDENGHGTVVALHAIVSQAVLAAQLHASGVLDSAEVKVPEIHSVKVLDRDGSGDRSWMLNALDHVQRLAEARQAPGRVFVNMSLGFYTKRWLFFDCKGECDLCAATMSLAMIEGVTTLVAAGNSAGATSCPGIAGLSDASPIITLAATSYADSGTAPLSAPGTVQLVPLPSFDSRTTGGSESL